MGGCEQQKLNPRNIEPSKILPMRYLVFRVALGCRTERLHALYSLCGVFSEVDHPSSCLGASKRDVMDIIYIDIVKI